MPRKNIYIRDDDLDVFEEAMEKLGEDEAIGTIIIEALKDKLNRLPEIEEYLLKLQLLKQLDLPALNEIIEYRLDNYPKKLVLEAEVKSIAAYLGNPNYFITPISDKLFDILGGYFFNSSKTKTDQDILEYEHPDYGDDGWYFDIWNESWIEPFMEEGLDSLINKNEIWFTKAKVLIKKGKKIAKETNKKLDIKSKKNE